MDLAFAGYRPLPVGPDDPLRAKWNQMRANLDFSGLAVPAPNLSSIAAFNLHVNQIITFNQLESEELDAWQSPAQTLQQAQGDCKDFALVKYAVLRTIGIPVRIVIGEIGSTYKKNPQHAWCAAFIDGAWRALDNMFNQIIKTEDYLNWIPAAAMHDDQVVHFGREFSISEVLNERKLS
jgi:transglutaminase-like putative cysteine protease